MARKDISDIEVCIAYRDRYEDRRLPYPSELLVQRTGQPEKVCWRAMERAYDRGYIEYGVSLRSGWLTDAGKALVESPPPTPAVPTWPVTIGLDMASTPDETAVGAWDSMLKGFVEAASSQSLQEWQARFLCKEVAGMRIPPDILNSIAPPKEQA